ncbi:MAG: zinc ribbon domain-containing protein [Oscillospiraceae bacterium]|nr:zinc ribbon domain-containing protein [Oscillospiraceae bacterium]
MKKRECVSCGAPIEVGATKCQYCGMVYEPEYWAGIVRYVPYHVNMRRVEAKYRMSEVDIAYSNKETLTNMAKRAITGKLAEALRGIVTYNLERDPASESIIVRGSLLAALDKD